MNSQDFHSLQEAYMEVYQLDEDGYKNPFQAPPAGGRTFQGNPAKGETLGNPARLSPAMRAMQRSDQLQRTEPGSRRQINQTRRSNQLTRNFASARRSGGSGGSSTRGLTSGASPSGLTGRFQVGTGTMLANSYEPDLYDIILSHLLDEGYAETPEAAEAIMVNMSEDWRDSIIG